MRLCVFCGSRAGRGDRFVTVARELGAELAARRIALVYGGASVGVMGALADAVLAAQGEAFGVIPHGVFDREVAHTGLTELHVVKTMHARKALMNEMSDAFLALPGGLGTLEELFEMWTSRTLGMHDKPVVVLDPNGFFDPLWEWLDDLARRGFVRTEALASLVRATSVDQVLSALSMNAS